MERFVKKDKERGSVDIARKIVLIIKAIMDTKDTKDMEGTKDTKDIEGTNDTKDTEDTKDTKDTSENNPKGQLEKNGLENNPKRQLDVIHCFSEIVEIKKMITEKDIRKFIMEYVVKVDENYENLKYSKEINEKIEPFLCSSSIFKSDIKVPLPFINERYQIPRVTLEDSEKANIELLLHGFHYDQKYRHHQIDIKIE